MAKEAFPGITIHLQVVHGHPVIAGTRVLVEMARNNAPQQNFVYIGKK